MDINNLTNVYNQNPTLQGSYTLQQYLDLFGGSSTTTPPDPDPDPTPTPTPTPGIPNIINQNLNRSGDDINRIANTTSLYDYRNPGKSAYGPKGQLEIDPSAFGMSFPEQPGSNKKGLEGFINSFTSLPTRSLSSFTSPTTGGNIVGPAEQGFMSQKLSNDPAGRTREELRKSYDDYNRFIGRSSMFADARQKGPAQNIIGSIAGAATNLPFLGSVFGGGGNGQNTSDRRRYAVDNAGFGQGTGRDEFGTYTGGKTLFGKTQDYGQRMTNKIDDIESFFSGASGKLGDKSLTGIDFDNLTETDIENMKRINGSLTKQYFAYRKRGEVDSLNKKTRQVAETKKRNDKIAADKIAFDKEKADNQAFQDAMANQQSFYASLNDGAGSTAGGAGSTPSQARESRDNAGGGAAANAGEAGSGWDSSPFAKGGVVSLRNGGSTNGSGKAALSAKVKELMDDGYEFGEAVKEAMKQGYANGGRIKSYFKGGLVSLRGR